MNNWYLYLIIIAVLFVFIKTIVEGLEKSTGEKAFQYKSRTYLLTKTEMTLYRKLLEEFPADKYHIFSKVRLADLIDPIGVGKERMYAFNKIKSKHIDFVITDHNSKIVKAIELDDYTHNRESARRNDDFKNEVLKSVGIELERR